MKNIQNINSDKINLINWIANLEDVSMLSKIKDLYLNSNGVIPEWQQEIVLSRLKDVPKEQYVSWQDVEDNIKFD